VLSPLLSVRCYFALCRKWRANDDLGWKIRTPINPVVAVKISLKNTGVCSYWLFFSALLAGCAQTPAVSVSISPRFATVAAGASTQFTASVSGDSSGINWSVNAIPNGNATVGTIDSFGNYTAPQEASTVVTISVSSQRDPTKSASAEAIIVAEGQVTTTNSSQVALYTISPPASADVSIEFGTDTSYGLNTWTQPTASGGGPVSIFVAGMRTNTLYHMRAVVQFTNGTQFMDSDHTFTAIGLPSNQLPTVTTSTTPGSTPQPGVEVLDITRGDAPVFVTDLAGNVIWSYAYQGSSADFVQPVKLLPNGHFLLTISPTSSEPVIMAPLPPGTIDVVREVDLAGNTVREISISDLNTKLAAAGYDLVLQGFHHDVTGLPNGHWIVLANTIRQFTDLPGYPGTTDVLGDVLVDLDAVLNPVWVWNEFDHLDVNRHPMNFPDWTHTNAVIYSADDGNLLVSLRHQNWLLKVDYKNGKGSGKIIWRLGYQGDFALLGGVDPTDWFYAQHGPSFFSANTTGRFSLGLLDNGNDRVFPPGTTCNSAAAPPCMYTAADIFQIDESAKTAELTFHDLLPTFSLFGGNEELLNDGDVEFDQISIAGLQSDVYEITRTIIPQTIWHLNLAGAFAYRGFRLPSLYPGVQW
jgi:arylsulfate sulfotransferase